MLNQENPDGFRESALYTTVYTSVKCEMDFLNKM